MTFSPNFFSFFLFSRHTSSTTREDGGATNRILQNARREREREREREKEKERQSVRPRQKEKRANDGGRRRTDASERTSI